MFWQDGLTSTVILKKRPDFNSVVPDFWLPENLLDLDFLSLNFFFHNCIGIVIISMLASSAVDCGFELESG